MDNEYKVIIAGGRDFNDAKKLSQTIIQYAEEAGDRAVSIVTGMAKGADQLAYKFAKRNRVQWYEFPANWEKHGKAAEALRNLQMAEFADALIAFWDGKSRETYNMIQAMKLRNKPVQVELY